MAKEKKDLRILLKEYMFEFDILQKIDCIEEDNKKYLQMQKAGLSLPEGVFQHKDAQGSLLSSFYTIYQADLSDEEKNEFLDYKRLSFLKTIKNCIMFFTVLTVIGMLIGIIMALIIQ